MRVVVAWILGFVLAANGLIMLAVPAGWYATMPGVIETGPFNPHFVRDIGIAYLVCGAAVIWFALDRAARPAAMAGAAFLTLHAAVHLSDAATGREHAHQLLIDVPTVFVPPLVAIWLVWLPAARRALSTKEKYNAQMVSATLDR